MFSIVLFKAFILFVSGPSFSLVILIKLVGFINCFKEFLFLLIKLRLNLFEISIKELSVLASPPCNLINESISLSDIALRSSPPLLGEYVEAPTKAKSNKAASNAPPTTPLSSKNLAKGLSLNSA